MTPHDETDEALRARLAARDREASAPVTPLTTEHLERAMSATRPRRTPLVAAGVAAVLAVGGGAVLLSRGDDSPAPKGRSVLVLKDPGGGAGASCVRLTQEVLAAHDLAFAGTVTSLTDTAATLDVTHWFKGGTADTVEITHDGAGRMSESLVLEQGKKYLIATSGEALSLCSGSGEDTPELRQLFDAAFA